MLLGPLGLLGPVAGTPGLDASIVIVSNYQPVTPDRCTSGLLQLECPAFIVKTPHSGSPQVVIQSPHEARRPHGLEGGTHPVYTAEPD